MDFIWRAITKELCQLNPTKFSLIPFQHTRSTRFLITKRTRETQRQQTGELFYEKVYSNNKASAANAIKPNARFLSAMYVCKR